MCGEVSDLRPFPRSEEESARGLQEAAQTDTKLHQLLETTGDLWGDRVGRSQCEARGMASGLLMAESGKAAIEELSDISRAHV